MNVAKVVGVLLLVLCAFWIGLGALGGESDREELVFMSIGDWGTGLPVQHEVAEGMEKVAQRENVQFILSLGDNFYDKGVKSLTDERWAKFFESVYTTPTLSTIPWHVILGDHDHRGSIDAQLNYTHHSPRWNLPSPYYTMFKGDTPSVGFIMTDFVGLEAGLMEEGDERRFGSELDERYTSKAAAVRQMEWLEGQLRSVPQAGVDWVVVVGHRPVLSNGARPRLGAEEKVAGYLRKMFSKMGVRVYLNGHDHTVQHINDPEDQKMNYFTNGGGGYGGMHELHEDKPAVFMGRFNGFCVHRVTREKFITEFIDAKGVVRQTTVVHSINVSL